MADTDTPFVNREKEVLELGTYNASLVRTFRNEKRTGKQSLDYRGQKFSFAAQMYGAGETRLGRELPGELLKHLPNAKLKSFVDKSEEPELREIMTQFGSKCTVHYYNLSSQEDFESVSLKITGKMTGYAHKQAMAFRGICKKAATPVLFHFDECGELPGAALTKLRDACMQTLRLMDLEELMTCFPFFYFSGRNTALFEIENFGSPVAAHWLILDPLKQRHVVEVMEQSTCRAQVAFPFISGLDASEKNRLADALIDWTAGAPRPLLYVLHMIQALVTANPPNEVQWSPEGLEALFKTLVDKRRFPNELWAVGLRSGQKLSTEELEAYRYLCAFARAETTFSPNAQDFDSQFPVLPNTSKYLRNFNVFTQLQPHGLVKLVVPRFVRYEIDKDKGGAQTRCEHSSDMPSLTNDQLADGRTD